MFDNMTQPSYVSVYTTKCTNDLFQVFTEYKDLDWDILYNVDAKHCFIENNLNKI